MCDGTGETETGQLPWARSRVSLSSFFVSDCARAGQRGWRGRFARAHALGALLPVCLWWQLLGARRLPNGAQPRTERTGTAGKTHGRCDAEEESQSLGKEAAAAEGRRGEKRKKEPKRMKKWRKRRRPCVSTPEVLSNGRLQRDGGAPWAENRKAKRIKTMAPKVSGDAFKDATCHILYINTYKHGGVWPGFAEVSRLPPSLPESTTVQISSRNVVVIEKPSRKFTGSASIWCFTALLDKEKENIQYMSIEKGRKITVRLLFPPTEALSGARIPFQRRARTHKFIFSPPDGNKIDARCTAMETGKLSLPWRQKRVLPASSAHHNVCVRHMIIHKKDSKMIFKKERAEWDWRTIFFLYSLKQKKIFSICKWKKKMLNWSLTSRVGVGKPAVLSMGV